MIGRHSSRSIVLTVNGADTYSLDYLSADEVERTARANRIYIKKMLEEPKFD
jgi:hypothetical protein